MAGSDPKASRPMGAAIDRDSFDAEEDPLVELARIVSEDGGFSAAKTETQKMNRKNPIEANSFTDGLEAELLQELESTLAAREVHPPQSVRAAPPREVPREIAPQPIRANAPREVPREVPPPPIHRVAAQPLPSKMEDERDPDELLRSIEEQLGQFERRQAERFAQTNAAFTPVSIKPAPTPVAPQPIWDPLPAADEDTSGSIQATEPEREVFAAPPPPPPLPVAPVAKEPIREPARMADEEDGPSRRFSRLRPLDIEDEAPPPRVSHDDWQDLPARPMVASPDYRLRGPANAEWDRPAARSDEPAPPPREVRRVSEEPVLRRPDPPTPFPISEKPEASPFAPHAKQSRVRELFDEPSAETESRYSAEAFRPHRRSTAFPEFDEISSEPAPHAEQDLTRLADGLAEALEPKYGDAAQDSNWERASAEEEDAAEPTTTQTPPPASRRAAAARAHAAQRGRAQMAVLTLAGVVVVLLIGGAAALYLRSTEHVPTTPPVIAADTSPVKVNADEQPATSEETVGEAVYNRVAGAAPTTDEQVVDNAEEPKEVARIVLPAPQSETAATERPVGEDQSGEATGSTQASSDEIGPRRVPTFTVRPDGTIVSNAAAPAPQPAAAAPAAEPAAEPPAPAQTAAAEPAPPAAETLSEADTEGMTPRPTIDESGDLAAAPAAGDENPTDLLTGANSTGAALPAPTASGNGFVVQVSSQRSQDAAQSAYAGMRERYASVLGNLDPNIQEADLGAKGIYYRVRVGPWASKDEAIQVCESLKTAGGSCFVTTQ